MPYRKTPLVTGEYFHIYNRGVAKMPIFKSKSDYKRFIKRMIYYQIEGPKPSFSLFKPSSKLLNHDKKIVEIIAYCLMPNHFHLLLKQVRDKGITEFVSKISNSYTKSFNITSSRVGPILQAEFKAVYIETNEQLLHNSRYVHLNPLVSEIIADLSQYIWSSYPEYLGLVEEQLCSKEIVLDQFPSAKAYKEFVLDQESYGKELELIKHQIID